MADRQERIARRAMLASLLLALPAAAAQAQDGLPAPRVRPAPKHETVPPSPGKSYEWAGGFWRWTGSRFIWIKGRYKARRPWSYRWAKGHAEGSGGLEKWVPGYYGQPGLNHPKLR